MVALESTLLKEMNLYLFLLQSSHILKILFMIINIMKLKYHVNHM